MLAWLRKPEYCFINIFLTCRLRTRIRQLASLVFASDSHSIDKRQTPERKQFSTWHPCNAQYVCMSKLLHQNNIPKHDGELLGFIWHLYSFGEFTPKWTPEGNSGNSEGASVLNCSNGF